MITKRKRHLREPFAIALVAITFLSAIYCVGSEDTTVCLISFATFICGGGILVGQSK